MKILFHLGHPAHYHLFKNTIMSLTKNDHRVFVLIKKKDILEDLLMQSGLKYLNILPNGRKDQKIFIALGQLKQDWEMFKFCIRNKPELLVGTSVAISHVGKLLRIPSLNFNEDDAEVVPLYAKLAYPFATSIIAPSVCSTNKWNSKTVRYNGYHELAYLHPNNFTSDIDIVKKYFPANKPFFIIRFASLGAHHDKGIKGINDETGLKIIKILKNYGNVYITAEREMEPEFEPYRIKINPLDIHHVLAFAKLYIGDSQTMAAEAGVLGTPFIRYNDFVGKIGYLNELENMYNLGFGFKTSQRDDMLNKIQELINIPDIKKEWFRRREKMLSEKIDVAQFMTWFIENYPESAKIMKENYDYQDRFK